MSTKKRIKLRNTRCNGREVIRPPRIKNKLEWPIAQQKLQAFLDHPSSIALCGRHGLDIDTTPIYIPGVDSIEPRITIDLMVADAVYLSRGARQALEWCLRQGPYSCIQEPVLDWEDAFGWEWEKSLRVWNELQISGHCFEVEVPPGWLAHEAESFWKFSEAPCGLRAFDLKETVFRTKCLQYVSHGLEAQLGSTPVNRTGGLRLGHEIARFDGIIPPGLTTGNS